MSERAGYAAAGCFDDAPSHRFRIEGRQLAVPIEDSGDFRAHVSYVPIRIRIELTTLPQKKRPLILLALVNPLDAIAKTTGRYSG
jgi:hypothetical protein